MPGALPAQVARIGSSGGNVTPSGGVTANMLPCLLTWYDPALGGTNSGNGQANPHSLTASGEPYDATKYTCAAPGDFAFGTNLLIQCNGKHCVVKVNDRGGAINNSTGEAHFDLSRAAADHLGISQQGTGHGTYKRSNLAAGVATTGSQIIGGAVNDLTAPFTSVANAVGFLFSKQFLYVIGGGLLLLVAIIMVFMRTGAGKSAAKAASVAVL